MASGGGATGQLPPPPPEQNVVVLFLITRVYDRTHVIYIPIFMIMFVPVEVLFIILEVLFLIKVNISTTILLEYHE